MPGTAAGYQRNLFACFDLIMKNPPVTSKNKPKHQQLKMI